IRPGTSWKKVSAIAHSSGAAGVDGSILDGICSSGAQTQPVREACMALVELHAGRNRVMLDARRGGRVSSWTFDGEELLVGPPDEADTSIHWGCFLMAPWPGRLAGGRFDWRGREVRLRRTHG